MTVWQKSFWSFWVLNIFSLLLLPKLQSSNPFIFIISSAQETFSPLHTFSVLYLKSTFVLSSTLLKELAFVSFYRLFCCDTAFGKVLFFLSSSFLSPSLPLFPLISLMIWWWLQRQEGKKYRRTRELYEENCLSSLSVSVSSWHVLSICTVFFSFLWLFFVHSPTFPFAESFSLWLLMFVQQQWEQIEKEGERCPSERVQGEKSCFSFLCRQHLHWNTTQVCKKKEEKKRKKKKRNRKRKLW